MILEVRENMRRDRDYLSFNQPSGSFSQQILRKFLRNSKKNLHMGPGLQSKQDRSGL